jgi:tetratricopeptide (TPR) repeat protein
MGLLVSLALLACEETSSEHSIPTTERDYHSPETQQGVPSPSDGGPLPELTVAIAGCQALSTKPTCLRLPVKPDEPVKPLYLWLVGDDPQSVTVKLDGQLLSDERIQTQRQVDGIWIELRTPTPGTLEVDYPGRRPFVFEVELLSSTYAGAYELLRKALRNNTLDADRPAIEHERQLLNPREAFLLDCALTRVGRLELEQLTTALADLRARAEAVNEIHCVGLATGTLINELTNKQKFDEAATQLPHLRRHEQLDLIARINAEHHAAILARDDGLLGDAHRGFDRAAQLAERIGDKKLLSGALIEQALVLTRLGRLDEAMQRASRAVGLVEGQPFALEIRFNKAWMEVLRRAQDSTFPDPSPELRELITEFADDPQMLAMSRLNLAVATMQTGDHTRAGRELAKVPLEQLELLQLLYYYLTKFRIELAAGKPHSARKRLERADLLAEVSHDREFELELLEAHADLELSEGNKQAALDRFEDADELAEALARQVPANAGRSNFWTTLSGSRSRHVELALETGERERALCTVLGARSRHLRALAAGLEPEHPDPRDDDEYVKLLRSVRQHKRELETKLDNEWQLADDELEGQLIETARVRTSIDEELERAMNLREHQLPAWNCAGARPSKPGWALLTAYPSADGASWLFLLDREGEIAWVRVVDDENPETVATRALEQFASEARLDGVTDLLVVPLGDLLAVNFQALPPFARPGGVQVRHGLGLGSANTGSSWDESAVVIGNSSANLSELEAELAEVRTSLGVRGWSLTDVWDPEDHEPPRLLHYGGHAARAGLAGWGSYLDLSDGPLTSEHLLLEGRAPAIVVLGACDAGAVDVTMLDGGMNVAVALLFAGAQVVIAADRKVDDEDARAFAQALYAALPEHEAVDANAMVAALTEVQRGDQEFQFGEWRAWVP